MPHRVVAEDLSSVLDGTVHQGAGGGSRVPNGLGHAKTGVEVADGDGLVAQVGGADHEDKHHHGATGDNP